MFRIGFNFDPFLFVVGGIELCQEKYMVIQSCYASNIVSFVCEISHFPQILHFTLMGRLVSLASLVFSFQVDMINGREGRDCVVWVLC